MATQATLDSDLETVVTFTQEQSKLLSQELDRLVFNEVVWQFLRKIAFLEAAAKVFLKYPIVGDVAPADLVPPAFLYGTVCMAITSKVTENASEGSVSLEDSMDLLDVSRSMVYIAVSTAYT